MLSSRGIFRRTAYRKLLVNGLKVLGVCSTCFLIEACYGTPQADYPDPGSRDVDLSGSVMDANGGRMAGAGVEVSGGGLTSKLMTVTDQNGRFLIEDVPASPEPYQLTVSGAHDQQTDVVMLNEKDVMKKKKHLNITLNN